MWLGVLSALAVLGPAVVMILSGAVNLSGAVGPVWLVVASLGLAARQPKP